MKKFFFYASAFLLGGAMAEACNATNKMLFALIILLLFIISAKIVLEDLTK